MTKSPKSKQVQKTQPTPRGARGARLLRLVLFATALIVIVVCAGGPFANGRANAQMRGRNLDGADWWLDVASRFPFGSAKNEFLRARLARKRGDSRAMIDHLQKASKLGYPQIDAQREQWLALAQAGQMAEAERHLAALLMDPRNDGAEILEAFAHGYIKIYRQNSLLSVLEEWIKNYPDDAEPLYLRGHLWSDLVRWKNAEKDFRDAVARDPNHFAARLGLADTLVSNKKPQEALEHFKVAERGDAQRLDAKVGQAKCHNNLGAPDEARRLLEEVLAVEPDHLVANIDMARIALGAREYERAYQLLQSLVEEHPRNYDLRQVFSSALRRVGKTEEADQQSDAVADARKALQRAHNLSLKLQKDEANVDVRYEVALIHLKYSSEEEGLMWLYGVLNYDADHKPTHEALANYYEQKEDRTFTDRQTAEKHRRLAQKDES